MAPFHSPLGVWPSLLTTLALATSALAQQDPNFNLTLTFSPSSNPDTCPGPDGRDSITISTDFLPYPNIGACLNLADVFTANTTSRNTSYSQTALGGGLERVSISFALDHADRYDPAANYSAVLYHQLYPTGDADAVADEDYFAPRNVFFYYGEDCLQGGRDGELVPWYLSNCRARGDCQQLSFSVGSFRVQHPEDDGKVDQFGGSPDVKGKCVMAAQYGAGSALRPGWGWSLAGVLVVGVWHLV